MKKLIIVCLLVFLSHSSYSQKARLEGDTITYNSLKVCVGSEINVFYGSGENKNFAFIFIGSGFSGVTPLSSNFSKSVIKIDKIYKLQGKAYARGKIEDSDINLLGNGKVFIDITGAVDMKEIKEN